MLAARPTVRGIRLYLIMDSTPAMQPLEKFLQTVIDAGAGMVQLREKRLNDRELLEVARRCARVCTDRRVPFIVNDRVDVALAAEADGLHLGQEDLPPSIARRLLGPDAIIGLSTHEPAQIEAASHLDVDYIGVGPIYATPTKPGRPAVGLELVRVAAERAAQPFFAIGGLDPSNVARVKEAGASSISVLRWITQSNDPAYAVRTLLDQL